MKHITIIIFAFAIGLRLSLHAAVPLTWTVETTRVQPAMFDVVRGETISLEAAFNNAGKPFEMDAEPVSIFWQTNGMGSAWWTAPAVAASNRVSATFTPEMDPGAPTVIGFLGSSGSIYRAAFTFRFRHGPGATPNALPLPQPVIDFAKVRVLNPPWGGGGVKPEAVREIAGEVVAPVASSVTNLSFRVSGLQSSKRDMTNLTVAVGFGWLDLPPMSEVRVKYDQWGDPEGNHWLWQGRDEDHLTRNGTKPGTYYFWPTAEAASNAVEVSWDYPNEVIAHRGTVTDSIALSSSVSNLSSRVSGLQSSKLDIGDAGTLGRFLGTYEQLGTERCRTDMAVGDVIFVKVQGLDVGQYARIVNAKVAGDVLEIADTKAIPSADFPTPGFAALLGMADSTLTVKGRPADAKATGDRFDSKLDKSSVDPTLTTNGVPSDAKATGDRFDALRFLGYTSDGYRYKVFLSHDEDPEYSTLSFGDLFPFYDFGTGQIWCGTVFSARGHGFYTYSPERSNRIAMNYDGFTAPNGWDAGDTAYFTAGKLNGDNAPNTGDWNQFRRLTRVTGDTMIYEGLGDVLDNFATKDDTYTKDETDALIAAKKPELEDIQSNVVWRIEAEGGRFFFKPVRPINMED